MFEHKSEPLLPRAAFARRMAGNLLAAFVLIMSALGIGAIGYKGTEGMSWIDAFLNAAMILTGMGPVSQLATDGGKLFAITYALGSVFVVLTVSAIMAGPVLHRLLHALHLANSRDSA